MRLLYVIATYGLGNLAGVVHRELGHEFIKRGHSFAVFAVKSKKEWDGAPDDAVEDGIAVHRAVVAGKLPDDWVNRATEPFFKYSRFVTGLVRYIRYIRKHPEFDLVLVEGAYPFGAMVALAHLLVGKSFVVSVTGGDFIASAQAEYGYGRYRIARLLMRLVLDRATLIRATTPLVRRHIIRYGGDSHHVVIVPANLADYSFLKPQEDSQEFRQSARAEIENKYFGSGFPPNAPLLVCAGRLLPIKGFDDAVRALAQIRQEFPTARLAFLGPDRKTRAGSYQKQLETLAQALGVREAVFFAGSIEHDAMKKWLAAADLVLVPSILEGMNRTVLEAAAVCTPAIVTQTAGIAEAVAEMQAGYVIEPRQPRALAAMACQLLRDPEQRAKLGAAGPGLAAQFSSARVGSQLVALCETALQRAQNPYSR